MIKCCAWILLAFKKIKLAYGSKCRKMQEEQDNERVTMIFIAPADTTDSNI